MSMLILLRLVELNSGGIKQNLLKIEGKNLLVCEKCLWQKWNTFTRQLLEKFKPDKSNQIIRI